MAEISLNEALYLRIRILDEELRRRQKTCNGKIITLNNTIPSGDDASLERHVKLHVIGSASEAIEKLQEPVCAARDTLDHIGLLELLAQWNAHINIIENQLSIA